MFVLKGLISDAFVDTERVTKKVNVYAFEVILLEMITGKKQLIKHRENKGKRGMNEIWQCGYVHS